MQDRTHCIAQRWPGSSFLRSALQFLDRLKRWYIGRNITLKNGEKLNDRVVHMRFFYDIMMANPWQWPVFYALLLSYAHMLGVLMPAVNVAIALAGVVLKTVLRPMYRARWRHILPEDDAHCTRHSSESEVSGLPAIWNAPSTEPVVEKAQHEPHWPWFFTGVTAPLATQSTASAVAAGMATTFFFSFAGIGARR